MLLKRRTLYILALLLGALAWCLDGIFDYLYFYKGLGFWEVIFSNPPAHEVYVRLSGVLLFLIFAAICAVILERWRRVAQERDAERKRLEVIFRSIGDAVLVTDSLGRVSLMNPEAERLTGWTTEQARGRPVIEVFHIINEITRRTVQSPVERVLAEGIVVGLANHTLLINRDGSETPIDDSGAPVRLDGGPIQGVVLVFRDVSARREAETRLRGSEARFRGLFEQTPNPVFLVNLQDRTVQGNLAASQLVNRSDAGGAFRGRLDQLPEELAALADPSRGEGPQRPGLAEVSLQTAVGRSDFMVHVLPVELTGESLTYLLCLDITERCRAEERLRESETRYRAVYEAAGDGILLMENNRFVDGNPAAFTIFESDREEFLGTPPWEVSPSRQPDGRPSEEAAIEVMEAALAGSPQRFEWLHNTKLGRKFTAEVNLTPVSVHGRPQLLAVLRDISERKKAEATRLELEARIQHAQKLESLGVLAGGIAHDFNNLLVGMMGNADLALLELSQTAPARSRVEEIKHTALRASELTMQMLAYSGKGRFELKAFSINELVQEMTHLLKVSISKNVVLKFNLFDDLPAMEGDVAQMRQVVMNLITNASDAIGSRSGVISFSTGVMEADRNYLRTTYVEEDLPVGTYLFLEVSDTGIGMDEATRGRIFDPFFTTKFAGRGLGLAAVLGIIRGHRGSIKVYSEPGRGTTFKILLPISRQSAEALAAKGPAVRDSWRGHGKVLLVDDDEAVRGVGRLMLERLGFSVITAVDGRDGLAKFRQHVSELRLVLLDMTMPHLNGEQTYREMRLVNAGVPVVLTSGYNEQDATSCFVGKGLAGFLQKPFQMEQLAARLRQALGE